MRGCGVLGVRGCWGAGGGGVLGVRGCWGTGGEGVLVTVCRSWRNCGGVGVRGLQG